MEMRRIYPVFWYIVDSPLSFVDKEWHSVWCKELQCLFLLVAFFFSFVWLFISFWRSVCLFVRCSPIFPFNKFWPVLSLSKKKWLLMLKELKMKWVILRDLKSLLWVENQCFLENREKSLDTCSSCCNVGFMVRKKQHGVQQLCQT